MGRTAVQPYTAVPYAVHVMPADPRSERESREHAASEVTRPPRPVAAQLGTLDLLHYCSAPAVPPVPPAALMRGEYWDANRALLRPLNVYPIILLHPHVTPKLGKVTYVTEEVPTIVRILIPAHRPGSESHPCRPSLQQLYTYYEYPR